MNQKIYRYSNIKQAGKANACQIGTGNQGILQPKLTAGQPEEEEDAVQTKLISRKEEKSTVTDASWLSGQLQGTKGSGNPLPDNTRASME